MQGTLALIGGGEFDAPNEALDRRLLAASGGSDVLVLPTADAFEQPDELVERAVTWFAGLGARASGVRVLTRTDALDARNAEPLAGARFVYLAGDSQLHLRSVLKDTPLWTAIEAVLDRGGVVAAAGASAAALCDSMLDSRGGGVTLGLGLVTGLTFVHRSESLTPDWLHRIERLAGTTVVESPTGTALLRAAGTWEVIGSVTVRGELPAPT